VGIGLVGLVAGVVYSLGYLIIPVQKACSPPWSPSSTTYGLSAVGVGWILTGAIGMCLELTKLIFWLVLAIVIMGISQLIAGTTVLFCHQMDVAGEVIYVVTFAFMCVGLSLCYMSTTEITFHLFPEKTGFAGSVFSVSVGIGNIVISQVILLLRQMDDHEHLNNSMIFFCLGIITIVFASPWIRVLSSNSEVQKYQSKEHERIRFSEFMASCRTVLFAILSFSAFFPILAVVMNQEPLMVGLWNTNDPPLSSLSAVLTSSYMGGRVFGLLFSDKVGQKRLWLLLLLLQTLTLLGLAVLVNEGIQNMWSRCLAIGMLAVATAAGAVFKVTSGGLCHELYDDTQQMSAFSLLLIFNGISCVAGSLAIEKSYLAFGSYKQFLYGSAGISFIAFFALLLMKSQRSTVIHQALHGADNEGGSIQCQNDCRDTTK
jgi:MFS family permease